MTLTKLLWLDIADVVDLVTGRARLVGLPDGFSVWSSAMTEPRGDGGLRYGPNRLGLVIWHPSFPPRGECEPHPEFGPGEVRVERT